MNNLWDKIFSENNNLTANWYKNITVVIKTFLRYDCLNIILSDWNKKYNNINIVVIDDTPSKDKIELSLPKNISYHWFDRTIGLSKGRNFGVSIANTKYVFISDDDDLAPNYSVLKKTYDILENSDFDIIGSQPHDIIISNDKLKCIPKKFIYGDIQSCDGVLNHFLAKKDRLCKWDENIIIFREHIDFFLQSKMKQIKVGAYKRLTHRSIKNNCLKDLDLSRYNYYRYNTDSNQYFMDKWKLLEIGRLW